jgi:ribonuclease HI
MQNTVFILVDASYNNQTKVAGIGLWNTFTKSAWSESLSNINSPHKAECYAIVLGLKFAFEKNLNNVVLFYDCMSIDTKPILKYFKKHFEYLQLVWVSRKCVSIADKIAFQKRKQAEKQLSSKSKVLKNKTLIEHMKKYSIVQIFELVSLVANPREKEIIDGYLKRHHKPKIKKKKKNIGLGSKKAIYFKAIVLLLPSKEQVQFCRYLSCYKENINHKNIIKANHVRHAISILERAFNIRRKNVEQVK